MTDFQGCFFGWWLFGFFHFWWIAVLFSTLSLLLSAECILYAIKNVSLFILFYVLCFPQSCGSYLVCCLFHVAENTCHRKAAWQQASLWACWHHPPLWALIQLSTQCLKLHSLWAQKMNTRVHLCILLPCKQIALLMRNQSNNGFDSLCLD